MRTFVATYKIYDSYDTKLKDALINRNIKYKFVEQDEYTLCYLTIIANNRLQMRKYKKEGLTNLKKMGKVELIVSVG